MKLFKTAAIALLAVAILGGCTGSSAEGNLEATATPETSGAGTPEQMKGTSPVGANAGSTPTKDVDPAGNKAAAKVEMPKPTPSPSKGDEAPPIPPPAATGGTTDSAATADTDGG